MYCPDFEPAPVITLNTPAGITSCTSLANSSTLNDVVLDGLNTVQHPLARTGASFQVAIKNRKFHGTICPTTPIINKHSCPAPISMNIIAQNIPFSTIFLTILIYINYYVLYNDTIYILMHNFFCHKIKQINLKRYIVNIKNQSSPPLP